jgi:8-amino-7-oxononanoate synthase
MSAPQKIEQYIEQKIQQRKDKNAFRTLSVESGLVDFCSNDYLGLARNKQLAERVHEQLMQLDGNINGSTGARTIAGTSSLTLEVEQMLAKFHKAESALIYNSGFTANLGLFSALPYRGDIILYDELIHASIRDGIGLSRANAYSFKHNSLESLEKRLQTALGNVYVAVESVYSMDGDAAPLKAMADLCKKYNAALIVDEAHSNGLYGEKGEGMVCELGLENEVFARVMTFGKAIGCHGAAVLGNENLKHFLINYSRPFIYTTAPSPHQLLSIKTVYDILSQLNDNRFKISCLVSLFKQKLQSCQKLELIESNSPIQCVIVPGNDAVKTLCWAVQKDGFDVRPIVAPTVPEGKERIRICFHAFNTEEEVIGLAESLVRNFE